MPPEEACTIPEESVSNTARVTDNKEEMQHLLVIRHGDRWDYAHPEVR